MLCFFCNWCVIDHTSWSHTLYQLSWPPISGIVLANHAGWKGWNSDLDKREWISCHIWHYVVCIFVYIWWVGGNLRLLAASWACWKETLLYLLLPGLDVSKAMYVRLDILLHLDIKSSYHKGGENLDQIFIFCDYPHQGSPFGFKTSKKGKLSPFDDSDKPLYYVLYNIDNIGMLSRRFEFNSQLFKFDHFVPPIFLLFLVLQELETRPL